MARSVTGREVPPNNTANGAVLRDAPINIPIMNPTYYGHQIFADASAGTIPHQRFVFASPAGRVNAGYAPKYQPVKVNYQQSLNMVTCESFPTRTFTPVQTHSFETPFVEAPSVIVPAYQPLPSIHEDYRRCKLNPLSCCHGYVTERTDNDNPGGANEENGGDDGKVDTPEQVVSEGDGEKEVEEKPADGEKGGNEGREVEQEVANDSVLKKPVCNFWSHCCGNRTMSNGVVYSRVNSIDNVAVDMPTMSISESVPGFGSAIPSLQYLGSNLKDQYAGQQYFSWFQPSASTDVYNAPIGNTMRSSISQQPSIDPSVYGNHGCFGNCWNNVRNVCGGQLATLQTQASLGLRNLYQTPVTQRSVISHAPSYIDHHVPELFFTPQQSIIEPCNNNACTRLAAQPPLRPNNFRLHAVEIHQYVPIPNMPSSRFVQTYAPNNIAAGNGCTLGEHNWIFNPNNTGPVAPMMSNVINGVCKYHVPQMYAMESVEGDKRVERLQTQESQIPTPNAEDAVKIE